MKQEAHPPLGVGACHGPLNTLLKGRVSTRLIVDHWTEATGELDVPLDDEPDTEVGAW